MLNATCHYLKLKEELTQFLVLIVRLSNIK